MLIAGTPTGDAHIIEEGGVQGQTEGNNGRNIHPCGLWQSKKFGCLRGKKNYEKEWRRRK